MTNGSFIPLFTHIQLKMYNPIRVLALVLLMANERATGSVIEKKQHFGSWKQPNLEPLVNQHTLVPSTVLGIFSIVYI